MTKELKYVLIVAGPAIGVKLMLFYSGLLNEYSFVAGQVYILGIVLSAFLYLKDEINPNLPESETFGKNFKTAMKGAVLYSFVVAVFTFCFYNYIDADFFPEKIAERIELAQNADIEALRAQDIMLKDVTVEELVAKEREMAELFYDPLNHTTFTLFLFLIASAIFSSILTYVMRRNPFKRRG